LPKFFSRFIHITRGSSKDFVTCSESSVIWINLEKNFGSQWAPNNHGIERARGKYIAYLGHDDLWLPNHLETLLAALQENQADVAFALTLAFGAPGCDGRLVAGVFPNGEYTAGQHVTPGAFLHLRSAALALSDQPWRPPTGRQFPTDVDFLTQLKNNNAKFQSVPQVTIFKFPASWRPNCYKEQRSDEQAKYAALIKTDPHILLKELHQTAISYELLKPVSRISFDYEKLYQVPEGITNAHLVARGLTDEEPDVGEPGVLLSAAMRARIKEIVETEVNKVGSSYAREIEELNAEIKFQNTELNRLRTEKNRKRERINRLRDELDTLKQKQGHKLPPRSP
ncbi:MAG: glycosyltransferase, partial [Verrucomicrobiota bacterium]